MVRLDFRYSTHGNCLVLSSSSICTLECECYWSLCQIICWYIMRSFCLIVHKSLSKVCMYTLTRLCLVATCDLWNCARMTKSCSLGPSRCVQGHARLWCQVDSVFLLHYSLSTNLGTAPWLIKPQAQVQAPWEHCGSVLGTPCILDFVLRAVAIHANAIDLYSR